jgi:cell division protein FtsW
MVVSGAAPTKGMPAPFFSYGGSNMVASLMAVGLICSVAYEECNPNYSERWLNAFFEKLSFIGRIFGKK